MAEEWALSAGDVLWRRSRLGLRFAPEGVARLEAWMAAARASMAAPLE